MERERIENPDLVPPLGEGPGVEVLGWRELLEAGPAMAKLLWRLTRDPRVPALPKLLAAASAVYIALPFDLIPDFLPVLGQLDDIAVLLVALDWLIVHTDESLVLEHWDGDPQTIRSIRNTMASFGSGWTRKISALLQSRRTFRKSDIEPPATDQPA